MFVHRVNMAVTNSSLASCGGNFNVNKLVKLKAMLENRESVHILGYPLLKLRSVMCGHDWKTCINWSEYVTSEFSTRREVRLTQCDKDDITSFETLQSNKCALVNVALEALISEANANK